MGNCLKTKCCCCFSKNKYNKVEQEPLNTGRSNQENNQINDVPQANYRITNETAENIRERRKGGSTNDEIRKCLLEKKGETEQLIINLRNYFTLYREINEKGLYGKFSKFIQCTLNDDNSNDARQEQNIRDQSEILSIFSGKGDLIDKDFVNLGFQLDSLVLQKFMNNQKCEVKNKGYGCFAYFEDLFETVEIRNEYPVDDCKLKLKREDLNYGQGLLFKIVSDDGTPKEKFYALLCYFNKNEKFIVEYGLESEIEKKKLKVNDELKKKEINYELLDEHAPNPLYFKEVDEIPGISEESFKHSHDDFLDDIYEDDGRKAYKLQEVNNKNREEVMLGGYYEGHFYHGKREGYGVGISEKKDIYGKPNTMQVCYYEGFWKGDKISGPGILIFQDDFRGRMIFKSTKNDLEINPLDWRKFKGTGVLYLGAHEIEGEFENGCVPKKFEFYEEKHDNGQFRIRGTLLYENFVGRFIEDFHEYSEEGNLIYSVIFNKATERYEGVHYRNDENEVKIYDGGFVIKHEKGKCLVGYQGEGKHYYYYPENEEIIENCEYIKNKKRPKVNEKRPLVKDGYNLEIRKNGSRKYFYKGEYTENGGKLIPNGSGIMKCEKDPNYLILKGVFKDGKLNGKDEEVLYTRKYMKRMGWEYGFFKGEFINGKRGKGIVSNENGDFSMDVEQED